MIEWESQLLAGPVTVPWGGLAIRTSTARGGAGAGTESGLGRRKGLRAGRPGRPDGAKPHGRPLDAGEAGFGNSSGLAPGPGEQVWSSLSGRGESLRLLDSPLDWRGRAVRASPASSPLLPRPGTPQGLGEPLWGEWMSRGIENTDLRGRSWELHQVPTPPPPWPALVLTHGGGREHLTLRVSVPAALTSAGSRARGSAPRAFPGDWGPVIYILQVRRGKHVLEVTRWQRWDRTPGRGAQRQVRKRCLSPQRERTPPPPRHSAETRFPPLCHRDLWAGPRSR